MAARLDDTHRPVELLVVGAGPTGLALALQARDHGATVRIVDRRRCAFYPSRALIMHARTLEGLRPLGLTDGLLAHADLAPKLDVHLGGRVARVELGDLALPDTAFPHLTLMRQADVEAVLANALAARGITVERDTALVATRDLGTGVCATLQSPTGPEVIDCDFLVGCDGQASTVRRLTDIRWEGARYAEEVVLADVELDTDLSPRIAHVFVRPHGVVLIVALGDRATWRLLATRPAGAPALPFGQPGPPLKPDELQAVLNSAGARGRIASVAWSARFPLQHRLAARFRSGRHFLAGDAAHAYSPATGQGMNAGIQDALNLGWKLAFSARARDCTSLLDSYELERRPVARAVLALTHVAFLSEASSGPLPQLLRGVIAPLVAPVVPLALSSRPLLAELVRVVSQLRVAYRASPLSMEGTPRPGYGPYVGDRLGDATVTESGRSIRLHELLTRPGVHVLLHRDAPNLVLEGQATLITVHRLISVAGAGAVAVRPDGFIGFRSATADLAQLRGWLTRVGAM